MRHLLAPLLSAALLAAGAASADPLPGGSLDPTTVPKYVTDLIIPPVMPSAGTVRPNRRSGPKIPYYEIEVVQFSQQILPPGMAATTAWSYAAPRHPHP